jgi:hypothetical protein
VPRGWLQVLATERFPGVALLGMPGSGIAPGRGRLAEPAGRRLARMSVGAAIALGAVLGLALGIVVSVTTDLPLAPEVGLVLGALVGWLSRRDRA